MNAPAGIQIMAAPDESMNSLEEGLGVQDVRRFRRRMNE